MSSRRFLALALVSIAAVYGCAAQDDDEATPPDNTEDELVGFKGSVDNAGLVEATTMMLAGDPTSGQLDPYNQEDPFNIRGTSYGRTFTQRLAQFDAYDRKTDWKPEQAAAWAKRMSSGNYIVIDTSKPCDFQSPHTYLEIERATMTGQEHKTCGGRMPNEDAMDVTLNFLMRGPAASAQDRDAIRDGVDHATKQATATFPYLAELNGF